MRGYTTTTEMFNRHMSNTKVPVMMDKERQASKKDIFGGFIPLEPSSGLVKKQSFNAQGFGLR